MKIILFLTTTGASVVSFKVVKENNIPFPKNSIELREVSAQIAQQAPEAISDIWKNDLAPLVQQGGAWFNAAVMPEIKDFFEEEVQPKIQEQLDDQESAIKEKIEENVPKALNDFQDVVKGDKKCEVVCE